MVPFSQKVHRLLTDFSIEKCLEDLNFLHSWIAITSQHILIEVQEETFSSRTNTN